MKVRQIESLMAAVELGSLRKAAQKLDISQPAVTQQINTLEESLNLILLRRTPGGVAGTPNYKSLQPYIEGVLRASHALKQEADAISGSASGSLTISAVPAASQKIIPKAMKLFRSISPQIQFKILEMSSEGVKSTVQTGQSDIGLLSHWIHDEPADEQETLTYRTVYENPSPLTLYLPAGTTLSSPNPLPSTELTQYEFIVLTKGHLLREAFDKLSEDVPLRIVYETTSSAAALTLVQGGLGASILPESMMADQAQPVIKRPLEIKFPKTGISIIRRNDEMPTSPMIEFTRTIQGMFI